MPAYSVVASAAGCSMLRILVEVVEALGRGCGVLACGVSLVVWEAEAEVECCGVVSVGEA